MDETAVVIAVACVLAGIAPGAVLGRLAARLVKGGPVGFALEAAVMAGVAAGVAAAGVLALQSPAGPALREAVAAAAGQSSRVRGDIRAQPLFAALLDEFPGLEDDFAAVVEEGRRTGGRAGAREAAGAWAAANVSGRFLSFFDRARAEDLTAWADVMVGILEDMNAESPEACFRFLYGEGAGMPFDPSVLSPALQERINDVANTEMAAIIVNAHEQPVRVDTAVAEAHMSLLGLAMMRKVGPQRAGMFSGQRPRNVEDARVLCEASRDLYASILTLGDDADDVLRYINTLN
jgi:hypothetical protein